MAPATSPFARGMSLRLAKSKTNNDTATATSWPEELDTEAPLIRTSFSDLKNRPDARAGLRRQFSSTFLESAAETAEEALEPERQTSLRGRLPRSRTAPAFPQDPRSAPASANPLIVEPSRLSAVNESHQLDVEQAISLLEQLKKTASPEQLVALHRALLPTKDVTTPVTPMFPNLDDDSSEGSAPPMRKSALLPPGLATRGGPEEDLLRKPSDFFLKPVPAKARKLGRSKQPPPGEIALAQRSPKPLQLAAPVRSETPELAYSHPGAFQHGTLRITNCDASPEPSLYTRDSLETPRDQLISHQIKALANALDVQTRMSHVEEQTHHDRSDVSPLASPSFHQRARDGRDADISPAETEDERTSGGDSITESPRTEIDEPDPADRHRAAHLSQEYMTHCDINSNPYASSKAPSADPPQGHPAGDAEDEDDVSPVQDPREIALMKLIGDPRSQLAESRKSILRAALAREPHSLVLQTPKVTPPPAQGKNDSGYSSDVSHRTGEQDTPVEDSQTEAQTKINPTLSASGPDASKFGKTLAAQERHSFREFLSSPAYATPDDAHSPEAELPSKKASSSQTLNTKPAEDRQMVGVRSKFADEHNHSLTSSPLATNASATDLPDASISKKRKLQKPMPASVREQREQHAETSNKTPSEPLPAVPTAVAQRFAQRKDPLDLEPPHSSASTIRPLPEQEALPDVKDDAPHEKEPSDYDAQRRSAGKRSKSRGRNPSSDAKRGSGKESLQSVDKAGIFARLRSKSRGRRSTRGSDADSANSIPVLTSRSQGGPQADEDPSTKADPVHTTKTRLGSESSIVHSERMSRDKSASDAYQDARYRRKNSSGPQTSRSMTTVNDLTAPSVKKSMDLTRRDDASRERPRTAGSRIGDRPSSSKSNSQGRRANDDFTGWSRGMRQEDQPPMPPPHGQRPKTSHAEDASPLSDATNRSIGHQTDLGQQDRSRQGSVNSSSMTSNRTSGESFTSFQSSKVLQAKKMLQARKEEQARRREEKLRTALETSAAATELLLDEARTPRWSLDKTIQLPFPDASPRSTSPTHDSQHPGWPGWEKQVKLWRQRNLERLGAVPTEDLEVQTEQESADRVPGLPDTTAFMPPDSVVSRNIGPPGAEPETLRSKLDADAAFGRSVTAPVVNDRDQQSARPDIPRTNSAFASTAAGRGPSLDERPAKRNIPRTDSAHSPAPTHKTWHTTTGSTGSSLSSKGVRARPGLHHAHTSSGKSLPLLPAESSQEPVSTSPPKTDPPVRPAESAAHQERFRAKIAAKDLAAANVIRAKLASRGVHLPQQPRPPAQKSKPDATVDRYSNGFQYGWEKDAGFSGSAGTRTNGDAKSRNRKSLKTSQDLGLDLSDVPVFLRKVN